MSIKISQEKLQFIDDSVWLRHQHHILKKSLNDIIRQLHISRKTLKFFLRKHNVQIIKHQERALQKRKETCLQKYGVSNARQTKESKDKAKQNYWYFKPSIRDLHSRIKFQKHKLPKLLENFDPTLTESQNMFNNGYRRIWDCGNLVYSYRCILISK